MAVTDGSAVAFCNNRIRRLADLVCQAYYFAKAAQAEYDANNMGSLYPNTIGDMVADGSPDDGRHPIDSADVNNFMAALTTLTGALEANNNELLNINLTASVNPVG